MLSDSERHELALIEQGLQADDRRFAARFGPAPRTGRRRRWPVRATAGFGALLVLVGLLTSTDSLFLQGVLFLAVAVGWSRWRAAQEDRAGAADAAARPSDARPDGSPPGGFRPA